PPRARGLTDCGHASLRLGECDDEQVYATARQQRRAKLPVAEMWCQQQDAAFCRLSGDEVLPSGQFAEHLVYRLSALLTEQVGKLDCKVMEENATTLFGGPAVAVKYRQKILDH